MSEILGKLLTAALVLAGLAAVFTYSTNASTSSKAGQALSDLNATSAAIQSAYNTHPSYSGLTSATVISSGFAPLTMNSGGALVSPWGAVSVAAASNTAYFTVTESSIPNDVCVKMASSLGNWTSLTVNGTSIALPPDPAVVAASCTATTNALVFTFH